MLAVMSTASPPVPLVPSRTGLLAGLLAAGPALLILVAWHTVTGSPGFLEALADGLTFLPIEIVGGAIATFGPLAKGLVYLSIGGGFLVLGIVAGGLVGLFVDRRPARPVGDALGLVVAAALFALAELVALPIFQAGPFGLSTGFAPLDLHVPLVLACVAYGVILVRLLRPAGAASAAPASAAPASAASTSERGFPRRTFLGSTLGVLGALSNLGALGTMGSQVLAAARSRTGGRLATFPQDSFGPTPALTPVPDFYVVAKDLIPPNVDTESWRLLIDGLVVRPTSVSLAALRDMPSQRAYRTLECISTQIVAGDHLIGNQQWQGVQIADLLDRVGVQPAARWILWEAADGYTESIPLDVARDPDSWIAYQMGGQPLPPEHGGPARVLIAGRFGMKQPKWVTRMHLASSDAAGYWEQRGWDEQAIARTMSRIDFPLPGDLVPSGRPFRAYGIADAGDRGISAVQLSSDGGSTWRSAQLDDVHAAPFGPLTWILWRADVTLATPGPARLVVRAVDGAGAVQSGEETDALPSGSTGWHAIRVVAAPEG